MSVNAEDEQNFFEKSRPIHPSFSLLILKLIALVILFDVFYAIISYILSTLLKNSFGFTNYQDLFLLIALIAKNIILIILVIYVVIRWATTLYYIDRDHLITREGIINIDENVYEFKTIRSLEVEQSLLGRILNYGNIILKTSASGGYLVVVTLLNLANPRRQERMLNKFF